MVAEFKDEADRLTRELPGIADRGGLLDGRWLQTELDRRFEAVERGEFASPERLQALLTKWDAEPGQE